MATEFMGCERTLTGDGWNDTISVTMYNVGQYNECHCTQNLTIQDAIKLRNQLTELINKDLKGTHG